MDYQLYESGGQYRWRLVAGNNRIVANSGEAYHNKSDCLAAITLVKNSAAAPIRDLTPAPAPVRRW